ncbi:MAG: hypothetical protein U1E98_03310 [Moraxella osloensis]
MAIFISALLDGLDGRAARLLINKVLWRAARFANDGFTHRVGLAPALLIYHYALEPLGRIGIACHLLWQQYFSCWNWRVLMYKLVLLIKNTLSG